MLCRKGFKLKMTNIFYYQTPIGKIGIAEKENQIINLYFESSFIPPDKHNIIETEVLKNANEQLQEYLAGKRKKFQLPLAPSGTEFMKSVWNSLCSIPYGETQCYQEIAQKVNHKNAYRAVGLANNRNPIPIFIPCHRVIGKNKKLIGYGGGLEIKKYLLDLEKQY